MYYVGEMNYSCNLFFSNTELEQSVTLSPLVAEY